MKSTRELVAKLVGKILPPVAELPQARRLPRPGEKWGACAGECDHQRCKRSIAMAEAPCDACGEPIGYETPYFVMDGRSVHEACYLEIEEQLKRMAATGKEGESPDV
jgi:hypothetical protein